MKVGVIHRSILYMFLLTHIGRVTTSSNMLECHYALMPAALLELFS